MGGGELFAYSDGASKCEMFSRNKKVPFFSLPPKFPFYFKPRIARYRAPSVLRGQVRSETVLINDEDALRTAFETYFETRLAFYQMRFGWRRSDGGEGSLWQFVFKPPPSPTMLFCSGLNISDLR